MRVVVLLLGSVLGWAVEAPPLPEHGAAAAAVRAALEAAARGDGAPLAALPESAWRDPPGIPDPAEPALIRRWSALLPLVAARAPGVTLPVAPDAAMAWERGDLATVTLLDSGPRRQAAARLLGWAEPAEPPLALPGLVEAADGVTAKALQLFERQGGLLLGRDPRGGYAWRRPLEQHALVFLGGPWAAVRGRTGAQVIGLDGRSQDLPAMPARARIAGVAGAAVWFVLDRRVWGLDPASGRQVAGELPDEPLGPPLARGLTGWWLSADHLTVLDGAGVRAAPHGLLLSAAARLEWRTDGPGIRDGSRSWRITDRPGTSPPTERHRLTAPADPAGAQRQADGSWRTSTTVFTCTDAAGLTTIRATHGSDVCWWRAWPGPADVTAPGRTFVVAQGCVWVVEGDRVTVLDGATGDLRAEVTAPGLDPLAAAATPAGLVAWAVGLGDVIRWVHGERGGEVRLDGPVAVWAINGDAVELRTASGTVTRLPGDQPAAPPR